jgi:major membrane immunogen (membrane-anchored lipoprotein)
MKKVLAGLTGVLMMSILLTSCTTADSSEVALVVDQIGNDKGIPNVELASGFIFYFPPT